MISKWLVNLIIGQGEACDQSFRVDESDLANWNSESSSISVA